jgi:hypothetical protein
VSPRWLTLVRALGLPHNGLMRGLPHQWRSCSARRLAAAGLVLLAALALGCGRQARPDSGSSSPGASRSAPSFPGSAPSPGALASPGVGLPGARTVPSDAAIALAVRWLRRRSGLDALAVIDSRGHLHGYHEHLRFASASLVKAMLLVQYLRSHGALPAAARAQLFRMIVLSDNGATDRVFAAVGARGLARLAQASGMQAFRAAADWALSQVTAADQARFFADMDRLIPAGRRGLARALLSRFGRYRGWGIPQVALRLGWRPFFKDGWIPTARGQSLLQVVRLERRGVTFTVAVFADGQPTPEYGVTTIRDVAWLLLASDPRPAP